MGKILKRTAGVAVVAGLLGGYHAAQHNPEQEIAATEHLEATTELTSWKDFEKAITAATSLGKISLPPRKNTQTTLPPPSTEIAPVSVPIESIPTTSSSLAVDLGAVSVRASSEATRSELVQSWENRITDTASAFASLLVETENFQLLSFSPTNSENSFATMKITHDNQCGSEWTFDRNPEDLDQVGVSLNFGGFVTDIMDEKKVERDMYKDGKFAHAEGHHAQIKSVTLHDEAGLKAAIVYVVETNDTICKFFYESKNNPQTAEE